MLSVVLSKNARARAVQLPAWNEALGLPRPFDQQWSLRLQQIMAYETDLLEFGDIFAGSREIAALVEKLKSEARAEIAAIDATGGAVKAIETGALKAKLVEFNTRRLEAIERGDQIVVGVNAFTTSEPSPLTAGESSIHVPSAAAEAEQVARLKAWRAARDEPRVARRCGLENGGRQRGEHHAALDRGGEGRRDDGRMGRRAAGRIRRISRPDGRLAAGAAGGGGTSRRCAGGGAGVAETRSRLNSCSASPASTAIRTAPSRSPGAPDAGIDAVYDGIRLTPADIVERARSGVHSSACRSCRGRMSP